MPQIKVDRIVSFTSEDPAFQASNILTSDTNKKWKCKSPGEIKACIVLQLDQPHLISGIDIGNENSAYVEVLVARSTAPEDFKVLLVMSSFMTPLEARQTQNVNKVRMFKYDDLSDPERNEKWDRVKIVCTQPFNRHVQYGLSFVNLYSNDRKSEEKEKPSFSVGKFQVRPESPDHFSAGSLFARKQQEKSTEIPKGAAASIREATSLAHLGSPSPLSKPKIKHNLPSTPTPHSKQRRSIDSDESTKERKERNRNELLYSQDEEDKHEKIDKLIDKRDKEKALEKAKSLEKQEIKPKHMDTPSKQPTKNKTDDKKHLTPKKASDSKNRVKESTSRNSLKRKPAESPQQQPKKLKVNKIQKPFIRLLEDVVLVISGIQNPDRASLRTIALSMGAKYKPDWDSTCTHLICAFANTPKFNQVKGKGKIVTRKWVEDCYMERKKLPWRRYALDKADKGPESEEEICEQDDNLETSTTQPVREIDSEDEMRAQGSDTDEKIAEIQRKQAKPQSKDVFSVDTDDEDITPSDNSVREINKKLEDFFDDKIFYVDESFDDDLGSKIKQYIIAYNGSIVENLEATIDIIVTSNQNYKLLQEIYPSATCVAPDWVWECHNRQQLVPMTDFIYK